MTSDGTKTLVWSARGELISLSGGTSASFAYDPFGRRARTTIDGVVTRYLYDRENVAQEFSNTLTPQTNLLGGLELDSLFALVDGTGARTALTDALGSTLALSDAMGALAIEYTYEPFGNPLQSGTAGSPYQYTGRENDGTGLQFSRARYYNPMFGHFISEDPLDFAAGDANLYAYVWSSPSNWIDPTGTTSYAASIGSAPGLRVPGVGVTGGAAVGAGLLAGFGAGRVARKAVSNSDNADDGGNRIPDDRIIAPPAKRGDPPIGDDGHPVEIHHRNQDPDGPLDEMTRTAHRGAGNYSKNHPNTGQQPSRINPNQRNRDRRTHWNDEWDKGRYRKP